MLDPLQQSLPVNCSVPIHFCSAPAQTLAGAIKARRFGLMRLLQKQLRGTAQSSGARKRDGSRALIAEARPSSPLPADARSSDVRLFCCSYFALSSRYSTPSVWKICTHIEQAVTAVPHFDADCCRAVASSPPRRYVPGMASTSLTSMGSDVRRRLPCATLKGDVRLHHYAVYAGASKRRSRLQLIRPRRRPTGALTPFPRTGRTALRGERESRLLELA